jgi:phage I-like protein
VTDTEGRIVDVLPLALTNFPATIGMRPLMAARGQTMDPTLEESLEALLSDKTGASVEVTAVYPTKCVYTGPDGKPFSIGFTLGADGPALSGEPETVEGLSAKDPKDPPAPSADDGGDAAAMSAASDKPASTAATMSRVRRDILILTGASNIDQARARFDKIREQAAMVPALVTRLVKLEKGNEKEELDGLIKLGRTQGKITDANEQRIRNRGVSYAREYLEDADPIVPLGQRHKPPAGNGDPVPTKAEREVARQFGRDPIELAKNRGAVTSAARNGAATSAVEADDDDEEEV